MTGRRAIRPLGRGILTGLIALGLLACAANAEAAQRYAAPGGVTAGSCPQAEPCRIDRAIDNGEENDQVIVLPGEYDVSGLPALSTTRPLTVHGTDPLNKPRIVSSGSEPTLALGGAGTSVYDLDLSAQGGKAALELGAEVSVSDVIARSNGTESIHAGNGQFRDTAAFAGGSDGGALYIYGSGITTIRNVTAISYLPESFGIFMRNDGTAPITIRNTIARGLRGDLALEGFAPGHTSVDVDYSSLRIDSVEEFGDSTTLTPGPHNQDGNTTVPLFADLAGGDVHQLAGSPTIDAGLADPSIGGLDFDGEARIQGTAPDIGADEYPPPTPSVSPISAPGNAPKRSRGLLYVAGDAVVRRGQAFLRAHCVGPGHCGGTIRLIYRRTIKRRRHGKVRKVRIQLLLGKKPFERSTGKRSVVRVPLYRRALRLLRRSRNHRLKVWMTGGGVKSRSLELRLARHRRHGAKHTPGHLQ